MDQLFNEIKLKNITFANRVVRAATFEGMASPMGAPSNDLVKLYGDLVKNNIGLIITGFNYVSQQGKAMQLYQAGIDSVERSNDWKEILNQTEFQSSKIFMQISHCGRQTLSSITGMETVAPSSIRCSYFKGRPRALEEDEIQAIISEYGIAAKNAKAAGFHGVQVHCAHGYLVHQFLSKNTNRRKDKWGGSLENRYRFLQRICKSIKEECGGDYPIIIKISLSDDRRHSVEETIFYLKMIEVDGMVDAAELSYGTMEFALNIFRGETVPIDMVLKFNPFYKNYPLWIKKIWKNTLYFLKKRVFIPYTENYNLDAAKKVREEIGLPLMLVGGIRSEQNIKEVFQNKIEMISISRPFVIDPGFITKLVNEKKESKCINCNLCAIMCDSEYKTKCFSRR